MDAIHVRDCGTVSGEEVVSHHRDKKNQPRIFASDRDGAITGAKARFSKHAIFAGLKAHASTKRDGTAFSKQALGRASGEESFAFPAHHSWFRVLSLIFIYIDV